jgi:hypothetical protein
METLLAKNLRIGNLVYHPGFHETIIVTAIQDDLINFAIKLCDIELIELTEEWLERFGLKEVYKYTENNQGLIRRGLCEYSDNPKISAESFSFDSKPSQLVCLYILQYEIKYVHQLQNLYHALTEKELKLEINKTNIL